MTNKQRLDYLKSITKPINDEHDIILDQFFQSIEYSMSFKRTPKQRKVLTDFLKESIECVKLRQSN